MKEEDLNFSIICLVKELNSSYWKFLEEKENKRNQDENERKIFASQILNLENWVFLFSEITQPFDILIILEKALRNAIKSAFYDKWNFSGLPLTKFLQLSFIRRLRFTCFRTFKQLNLSESKLDPYKITSWISCSQTFPV